MSRTVEGHQGDKHVGRLKNGKHQQTANKSYWSDKSKPKKARYIMCQKDKKASAAQCMKILGGG